VVLQDKVDEGSFFNLLTDGISADCETIRFKIGLTYFGLSRRCWDTGTSIFTANRWWDNTISPHLVRNWYHEVCKPPVTEASSLVVAGRFGVVARVLNQGIVYGKTTDLIPHHVSTSNAGVLFDLLRLDIGSLLKLRDR
jgi:hypothetical protein